MGVVYALIVGIFIHKELGYREIYESFRDSVLINGATTFMIGLSISFANFLTMEQVPASVANMLLSISDSSIVILMLINLFLLFVGCFIDNISSCIILAPILLPIVTKLGMDPVQFGVVMTINLATGFVTPPYGANLFIASAVAGISVEKNFQVYYSLYHSDAHSLNINHIHSRYFPVLTETAVKISEKFLAYFFRRCSK